MAEVAGTEHGPWLGGWNRQYTKLEGLYASWSILWALHLVLTPNVVVRDPVATAMDQCGHVPVGLQVAALLSLGICQYAAAYHEWIIPRRICMALTLCWWCFVVLSMWRFAPQYPGSTVVVGTLAYAFAQLMFLCRRRASECTSTTAGQ